jgi:hypothetical protein
MQPAPHDLIRQPATCSAVVNILKNPMCVGTHVYGRHTKDPTRRKTNIPNRRMAQVAEMHS